MNNQAPPTSPLVIAFVSDLMFTMRIAKAVEHLGYRIEWIERADQLGAAEWETPPEKPGESLYGREGRLFAKITMLQPSLMVFDLNNQAIPWQRWIAALKSSPATRRLPILCFGPHEDVDTFAAARHAGADSVVARSRFSADLPKLLAGLARVPDRLALLDACAEPLSELARAGIERFNQGLYYRSHDALEEAWMQESGPGRELYRGILQVAIAYYQVERGNYRGAVKMLLRMRQWLEPLPSICRGVNVAQLRSDAERAYSELVALGPEQIDKFDRNLFRPIQLR